MEAAQDQARKPRLLFRAFKYRNYRLFFSGQSTSLIGTWMQRTAMGWLVYRLTDSPFLLGFVGFADHIPSVLITPFAGVLIDRWDRHRVLIVTQTLAMLQAFVMAALIFTGAVQVWHIISLSLFLGAVNSFDMPARQTFVVEMVEDRRVLGNALALNSSMVQAARLVGPALAGMIIAFAGEGGCFLINGVSYLAVIASLLLMKIRPVQQPAAKNSGIIHGLKEGLIYAFGFFPIKSVILLLSLVSLLGLPYVVLMPIFARDILHGGPKVLGFLLGAIGIGALSSAVYLAARKSVLGLPKILAFAPVLLGLSLIVFSRSHTLWLSLIVLTLSGAGMIVQFTATNTLLQTIVEDDKRGRVMSFYTLAFMGTYPLGSLIEGSLASRIGAPDTLLIAGLCCILGAAVFAWRLPKFRKAVRPVYVRKGIITES